MLPSSCTEFIHQIQKHIRDNFWIVACTSDCLLDLDKYIPYIFTNCVTIVAFAFVLFKMTPEEMIKDYILTSVEIFIIFFLFSSLRSAFSRIRKLSFVLKVLVAVASFAVFVVFRIYYLPNIFLLNKIDPEELVTVMKAAEFAPNEKFRVITAPVPIPTDFEVLVKVKAVSLNPVDYKLNKAKMPILRWIRAHTPVQDVSGVVVLPGKHCGPIYAGDEVFGLSQKGALAEYALISCSLVSSISSFSPFYADYYVLSLYPYLNFYLNNLDNNKTKEFAFRRCSSFTNCKCGLSFSCSFFPRLKEF